MYQPQTNLEAGKVSNEHKTIQRQILAEYKIQQDKEKVNTYLNMVPSYGMFNYNVPKPVPRVAIYDRLGYNAPIAPNEFHACRNLALLLAYYPRHPSLTLRTCRPDQIPAHGNLCFTSSIIVSIYFVILLGPTFPLHLTSCLHYHN